MSVDLLDPRADNHFGYDKEAQAWVLVQTWHVYLHFKHTPKDKYEVRLYRAGIKFETEPSDDDIKKFAEASKQGLIEWAKRGEWYGDLDDNDAPIAKRFNRWAIKDFREA